jgi:hypothetical protein
LVLAMLRGVMQRLREKDWPLVLNTKSGYNTQWTRDRQVAHSTA